jgi:hypothetical protein
MPSSSSGAGRLAWPPVFAVVLSGLWPAFRRAERTPPGGIDVAVLRRPRA